MNPSPLGGNISRTDGRAKTTGAARYSADYGEPDLVHAVLVSATIGLGSITAMDSDAATHAPGVLAVYYPFAPLRLQPVAQDALGERYRPLQDREVRFHGQAIGVVVADEGVPFKAIAEVIARRLNVPLVSKSPEEAAEHFGMFGRFVTFDVPTSSARTRARLDWQPQQPGLIADIDHPAYFAQQRE